MEKKLSTKQLIKKEEKALKKKEKLKKKGIEPPKVSSDNLGDSLSGSKIQDAEIKENKEAPDLTGGSQRQNKIAIEKEQEKLERVKYMEDSEQVEALVPIAFQRKFLYYTTTIKKLERTKRTLAGALTFFIIATIAFTSLYMYERGETTRTYTHMCNRAIEDVIKTIEGYENNPIDADKFSHMITGETNTVRMAAEILEVDDKYTNQLNDIYHLMVNCPEQMKKKYEDMKKIYQMLRKNIEDPQAYKKIDTLYKSIDLKGK